MRPSPPTSVVDLRNLAERILQGDVSAETELVHQFSRRIFVMAWVRTRDREAARELVQDVLMAVIGALRKGQLRDAGKLAAFVHGTARNLINNQLRNIAQSPPLEPLPEELSQAHSQEFAGDDQELRLVHQALQPLSSKDRQILLMTLVEGCKPSEIAAALGLTSQVVRTRKLRAIQKVREFIKKKMSRT